MRTIRPERHTGLSIMPEHTVYLGAMPRMLRDILAGALDRRNDLRRMEGGPATPGLTTVLRGSRPQAVILGRPDCDPISIDNLLNVSPATGVCQVSSTGRVAVVYRSGALPQTVEGLSPDALLALLTRESPEA